MENKIYGYVRVSSTVENTLFLEWISTFPDEIRKEWASLLTEMNEQVTVEAKLYKPLDKLEAVISHNESDLSTWLPLEYDLQFTYGAGNVQFSEYLKLLKEQIDEWTSNKIQ